MPIGQTSKGRVTGGSSIATTGVNTSTSGSTFVVYLIFGSAASFSSISDTINGSASGNTWTQVGSEVAMGGSALSRIYYAQNANGGTNHVVTVNVSAGTEITVLFVELTGVQTSSVLDQSSHVADASSPFTSGNITTTVAQTILVGGIFGIFAANPATHAISSASPSGGWTIQSGAEELDGSLYFAGALATQTVSATGTYNSGFTEGGPPSNTVVMIAAFKLIAGPVIDTQPADTSAFNGATAAFSVSATTSGGTLTYQWQVSTDRCATYGNVGGGSGGTTANYTTATLAFSDHETFYRCVVTDDNGSTNTRGAALRIKPCSPLAWTRA